ncbi:T7SS effector LXG polymorphic toxin [Metabacillus sp. JX24]|uniref:T7SS effector LXG polymorphic toxin n=1 Tax=Metabacillus sp. JX24 TaxID=3240759 RepID=UPI00350EBCF3
MTHVLDADAFHSAIEKTKERITSQTAQIKQLETAVKGIIDLDDAFKGEGGEAIRFFYEKHHLPVMASYSAFLAHYQTTLDSMKKSLHNLEPSRSGYIRRSFLDQQVEQDLTRARERTNQLTNETNATINRVADIVALPKIDDRFFAEMVEKARREKNQTSEQLSEFDHRQASLLTNLENELQTVVKKVNDLQNLFQPATVKTDGQVQGASCEKPANTDVKEDKNLLQIIGDVFVGIAEGIYQFVKDLFVGLFDLIIAIFTDFPGLVMGIINAVINIDETIGAMIGALEAAWERDVINGDARSRSRFFTYGIVSAAATYFTLGLDKVSKAGKLSKLGKLAEAEKPKSIPFNVMDTAKLKDYMKENVIKEAHRYKKQISDFVQSNLFKTIVNMKALSNQAADIYRKAKHVLNPEKINVLLKKTYEDVVKGPLVRTKMGVGRMVDAVMNTPISRALAFNEPMDSDTLRDVAKNAGDTIVNASKSVERVVGDVSGKIEDLVRGTGNRKIQLDKEELDALRKKWNVPETNTIAVGKTDVKGLEHLTFEGGSPEVRKEAGLPSLDSILPNREFRAPYDHLKNPKLAQFTRHAEEGVLNEFDSAINKAGIAPISVTGILKIHQSNPRGVCNKCSKGLLKPYPIEKSGIFFQASKKYPNLIIDVTSEVDNSVKVNGLLSFKLKDGKIIK